MRGAFLDLDSIHPADLSLDALQDCLDEWQFHASTHADKIHDRLAGTEVVVTNKVPLGRDQLLNAPRLKLICVAATGTNNVDLDSASAAGIAVCNARDYATASVTETVFTLLLQYHSSRLIVTPHIAWASRPARQQLRAEIIANIRAFQNGQTRNRVNPGTE